MEINKLTVTAPTFCCRKIKRREKKDSFLFQTIPTGSHHKATEIEIPYRWQRQQSIRSSSTWKIPYHPISSRAEGAGCCWGAEMKRKKASLSHTEVISCPSLMWVDVYQWLSADKHLVGVYSQSFLAPADCWRYLPPGARWAHLPPFSTGQFSPPRAGTTALLHHPVLLCFC